MLAAALVGFWPEADRLADDVPLSADDQAVVEELEQLVARPIDVNRATLGDLLAIPWLDYRTAGAIVAARDSLGGFAAVADIARVPGISAGQALALAPLLRVETARRTGLRSGLAVRLGCDSFRPGGVGRRSGLARARAEFGRWSALVIAEKDPGDARVVDCVAAGLAYGGRGLTVLAGDFDVGLGQGLHFSGPRGRSRLADRLNEPVSLRPVAAAPEVARLTGLAIRQSVGPASAFAMASRVRRDARIREDGTVERLVVGGTHGDSSQIAAQGVLPEECVLAGAALGGRRLRVSLAGSWYQYGRRFEPADPATSFSGRRLAVGGVCVDWLTNGYEAGLELARSVPGGGAAAVGIAGAWPGVSVRMAVRAREQAFFAPHSRWTSLSVRKPRLDASGSFTYSRRGLSAGVSGNTFREYDADSLPARVRLRVGQEAGPVGVALEVGRSFRGEEERSRDAGLRLDVRGWSRLRLRLELDDRYRETRPGHGTALQGTVRFDASPAELAVAVARVWLSPGMTLGVAQPGVLSVPGVTTVTEPGWRVDAAMRVGRPGPVRLAFAVSCAFLSRPTFGGAVRLEVSS